MFEEEFTEEGIIASLKDGFAEIKLENKRDCSECGAKLICRNNDSGGRLLSVENNFKGKEGDRVRITVRGRNILEAAFLLYGIPVFLIVFGAAVGMMIFKDELTSSLAGFGLAGLFFLLLLLFTRRKKYEFIVHTVD